MSQTDTISEDLRWLLEQFGAGLATAIESMGSERPGFALSQAAVATGQDGDAESSVYDLSLVGGQAFGISASASAWKEIATQVLTGLGMDSPAEQVCLETYREVIGQAVSLLAQSVSSRLKKEIVFVGTQSTSLQFDSTSPSPVEVTFGSSPPVLLCVSVGAPLFELLAAPKALRTESGTPDSGRLMLEDLGSLEALEMGVTVSLGTARLTLADAIAYGPGSVVQLESKLDDLVVVKVDGKIVARGEVVAVDNRYAVRITHIADLRTAAISDRSSVIPSQPVLQRVFKD